MSTLHSLYKTVEEVARILRSGTCFRVELNREYILSGISQTLVRSVVYIYKCRNRDLRIELVSIDDISMILRGDVNSPRLKILYRVITATVTVFQFMSISPCRERHELVSKAYRKYRDIRIIKFLYLIYLRNTFLRIAGAITQHNAIWI